MKTIEERAEEYAWKEWPDPMFAIEREDCKSDYIKGATEQKVIDTEHTISCLKSQREMIADRVCDALDGIYFANEDARERAKKILKKVIERERKEDEQ